MPSFVVVLRKTKRREFTASEPKRLRRTNFRLDGRDDSKIRLFEPGGQGTFEILAKDPSPAPLWHRFSEPPAK
jgi:hypothetical protein